MVIRTIVLLPVMAGILVTSGSPASAATPGTVQLLSLSDSGATAETGNGEEVASTNPSVSADGRLVAFDSNAVNLTPGDTNGTNDVFLRDRVTGTTTLLSRGVDGQPANGYSGEPVISADGGSVAFISSATNLVTGDINGQTDVFVRDLRSGSTTRANVASDGTPADRGTQFRPSISADGSAVAFTSDATNLVADHRGQVNVFVRDLRAGSTTQINLSDAGRTELGNSQSPSISADGHLVAFASVAPLVKFDTNRTYDIFLRDLTAGITTRVSVTETGGQRTRPSTAPALSGNGNVVAYVGYPPIGVQGIYMQRLDTTKTSEVSVDTWGISGDDVSSSPSISTDGRFVAFASTATNLVPGDTNNKMDVFLRDTLAGGTTQRSVPASGLGAQSNGYSADPSVSANGYVAFTSSATNLVENDTTPGKDVFGLSYGPDAAPGGGSPSEVAVTS